MEIHSSNQFFIGARTLGRLMGGVPNPMLTLDVNSGTIYFTTMRCASVRVYQHPTSLVTTGSTCRTTGHWPVPTLKQGDLAVRMLLWNVYLY